MRSCTPLTLALMMMRSCLRPSSSARRALSSARHDDGLTHDVRGIERFGALRVLVHQARQQVLIETAPVDADAHRLLVAACDLDHLGELRVALAAATDVAGIDPVLVQRLGARRMLLEQLVPVEVKVTDQRHAHAGPLQALADDRHLRRGLGRVDRDAHQLGAGARQRLHLFGGGLGVGGVGIGHRLHHDRCAAADLNTTDEDGDRMAASDGHESQATSALHGQSRRLPRDQLPAPVAPHVGVRVAHLERRQRPAAQAARAR